MLVPAGNLVLLHDNPEGCNKIQNNNKDQIYVVTSHHEHKNTYFVKPLGSKIQPKQVNRWEMFDLGIMEEQEIERQKHEEEDEKEDEDKDLPLYQPSIARKKDFNPHQYNLRPRDRKSVNSRTILMSSHL